MYNCKPTYCLTGVEGCLQSVNDLGTSIDPVQTFFTKTCGCVINDSEMITKARQHDNRKTKQHNTTCMKQSFLKAVFGSLQTNDTCILPIKLHVLMVHVYVLFEVCYWHPIIDSLPMLALYLPCFSTCSTTLLMILGILSLWEVTRLSRGTPNTGLPGDWGM